MIFGHHLHHLPTGGQGQAKPGKLKKLSSVEAGFHLFGAHDLASIESTGLAAKSGSPGSTNATPLWIAEDAL